MISALRKPIKKARSTGLFLLARVNPGQLGNFFKGTGSVWQVGPGQLDLSE
jgi:hypothetical protein